jgi:hypothetical protein
MLQSATYCVQMFESVNGHQAMPPDVRTPADRDTEDNRDGANGNAQRQVLFPLLPSSYREIHKIIPSFQKPDETSTQEGQTCLGCSATSTPEWRRGPMGEYSDTSVCYRQTERKKIPTVIFRPTDTLQCMWPRVRQTRTWLTAYIFATLNPPSDVLD